MNVRTLSQTLFTVTALALSGALSFAQQPPTPATPPTPASPYATPAAPIERLGPSTARAPRPPRGPAASMMRGPGPIEPMMHDHGMRVGPMGFGMERKWWQDQDLAQQLNLAPDQIKRMDTVFEQSKLQLIDLRASLQKQEVLLEPLLSANPVDMAKAKAQIAKVAHARADLEVASAAMLLGIRAILTPDQWTKLNDRHGRHDFYRRNGPGNRRDGQPGAGAPQPPAGAPQSRGR
jgi:Spy/CpxP family protein refolding chaperone